MNLTQSRRTAKERKELSGQQGVSEKRQFWIPAHEISLRNFATLRQTIAQAELLNHAAVHPRTP
jgi:hypothetical protein